MVKSLKHVGRIKNTGNRCVVVFREIYDDHGNVVDEDNCLIFKTDSLPDAEHEELMKIVESDTAQSTGDLFNVLARVRLSNGLPALQWLANSNRLVKFPVSNIEMTPDPNTVIELDMINKIVRMQESGMSQKEIEATLAKKDQPTNDPSITNKQSSDASQSSQDGVLDDRTLAKNFINQAKMFEKQAKELRQKAYELDPTIKPGPRAAPHRK